MEKLIFHFIASIVLVLDEFTIRSNIFSLFLYNRCRLVFQSSSFLLDKIKSLIKRPTIVGLIINMVIDGLRRFQISGER